MSAVPTIELHGKRRSAGSEVCPREGTWELGLQNIFFGGV